MAAACASADPPLEPSANQEIWKFMLVCRGSRIDDLLADAKGWNGFKKASRPRMPHRWLMHSRELNQTMRKFRNAEAEIRPVTREACADPKLVVPGDRGGSFDLAPVRTPQMRFERIRKDEQ